MATSRSAGYVVTASVWNAVLSRLTDDGVTFSGNFNGGTVVGTTITGTTITASTAFAGAGDITITGDGPHAIGAATQTSTMLRLGGTFTGSGATVQKALSIDATVNGVSSQDTAGLYVNPSLVSDNGAMSAGIYLPVIAAHTGPAGIPASGAALYIAGATTGATTNYAAYVAAGTSYFGGPVQLRGTTGDGTWQTEAFNAGHYTANGSMTWTVGSGDVGVNRYTRVNDVVIWTLTVNTTTVGGTPNTQLRVTLPGGFTAAGTAVVRAAYTIDNGTAREATVTITSGTTYAAIARVDASNWTASTDNTYVFFQIAFEI